jgi:hypothetical protein
MSEEKEKRAVARYWVDAGPSRGWGREGETIRLVEARVMAVEPTRNASPPVIAALLPRGA